MAKAIFADQISLFDIEPVQEKKPEKPITDRTLYVDVVEEKGYDQIRAVGDKIARLVLGEVRTATVTKVEGSGRFLFYRTDSGGCYNYQEGLNDIEELERRAEEERQKYQTIEPRDLKDCFTMEFIRKTDGRRLWKQVGIFNNMLFWKDWITYQFLEPYKNEKELRKAYEKFKGEMLKDLENKNTPTLRVLDQEEPMRRLYWSNKGFYTDAEYVHQNG